VREGAFAEQQRGLRSQIQELAAVGARLRAEIAQVRGNDGQNRR
jgi:hypothetical protein